MNARQLVFEKPKEGKVLIVEDDELIGKCIKADLDKQNIDCVWETSYDGALRQLQQGDFHAIVVDVFLDSTEANGLELVKFAKNYGIPSVIITSALDREVAKVGLNNGAEHLLEKPFAPDALLNVLLDIWENPRGMIGRRDRFLAQHQLTPKESNFCRLILKGLSNQEIADAMNTTLGTVKFYSSQIFQKCAVKNRSELFNLIFPT